MKLVTLLIEVLLIKTAVFSWVVTQTVFLGANYRALTPPFIEQSNSERPVSGKKILERHLDKNLIRLFALAEPIKPKNITLNCFIQKDTK